MKLENLVPPLELCRNIKAGEFGDSSLVWTFSCNREIREPYLALREDVDFCRNGICNAPDIYPAPTLQEIMAAFHSCPEVSVVYVKAGPICEGITVTAANKNGNLSYPLYLGDHAASNALHLWFYINHGGSRKLK